MSHESEIYDEQFYDQHRMRKGYPFIAGFLFDVFRPKSAVDFGCGIGRTLFFLKSFGVDVIGIESSNAAQSSAQVKILPLDLSEPVDLGKRFDLVISIEVAEHLPECKAALFVESLTRHASEVIFFTAAQVGQGGTGHVNCQFKEYWAAKFMSHGFRRARLFEWVMKFAIYPLSWEMPWVSNNAQIFLCSNYPIRYVLARLPVYIYEAIFWRFKISRLGGGEYWLPRRLRRGDCGSI
ncbi:class I SAM-dependent methyltransferase [Ectothiorhodospira shaposhnikovii]|uniref:class I SAM-dependent methyltransferase n=1 Tax=Ectothiorhodospira shaposhnikovii TaxID=1054 RepID=UPI001EE8CB63|nr:methyltransferase domain-containing protein [Ectothiorhodospira shaposhnikovii]MCG5512081.1 class I SAM-dependent methyltransferase [Ectothiorhodospira shaposhnikovii]